MFFHDIEGHIINKISNCASLKFDQFSHSFRVFWKLNTSIIEIDRSLRDLD
jgi:hypothetical protein